MAEPKIWLFRRSGAKQWTYARPGAAPGKRVQRLLPPEITTRIDALRYVREHRAELDAGEEVVREGVIRTVADLVKQWRPLRKADERLSSSTIGDSISHLDCWILPRLGDVRVERLDVPTLRAFVRALRVARATPPPRRKKETPAGPNAGRTIAPYTVRNVLATLAALLDDAEGEGWAQFRGGNPARAKAVRRELPEAAPRVGHSQVLRVARVEDAERVMNGERVPLARRVRYAIAFTSGLRDGEIAGLTWADVDLETAVGRVRKAVQLKGREGFATVGRTKTRDSVRSFPLHPAAVAALIEWKKEGWVHLVGHAPRPHDLVLPNGEGGPLRPRSAELFREDAAAVGLPAEIDGHPLTFHALRRSFSSWLADAGVPKEVRDRLMGHVPRSTGERHYTEQGMGVLAEAVGRIGLRWRGGGG